jgi:hypothetical protein
MATLPKAFETFRKRYRSVYEAYEALGGTARRTSSAGVGANAESEMK